jgi:hypothetical protein
MMARSIIESLIFQESPALNAESTPNDLVGFAYRLIAALGDPGLAVFLEMWPPARSIAPVTPVTPAPMTAGADSPAHDYQAAVEPDLPVLAWLPQVARGAEGPIEPVVSTLAHLAGTLSWRQTYTEAQMGADFTRNYGYTEIIGLKAVRPSARIACGFLLLGPHTHYPRHRHEAREIYVTLSGTAQWLQGDEIWRERRPGAVIHHASHEAHAMQTGADPMLALYLWHSENLNQKARLDADASLA